jgi:hypothetical protein
MPFPFPLKAPSPPSSTLACLATTETPPRKRLRPPSLFYVFPELATCSSPVVARHMSWTTCAIHSPAMKSNNILAGIVAMKRSGQDRVVQAGNARYYLPVAQASLNGRVGRSSADTGTLWFITSRTTVLSILDHLRSMLRHALIDN